jgi:integrase
MFDSREAKMLEPGEHITFTEYPGLRLEASTKGRSWIYRYKSPIDSGMRQVKIGSWPAMSFPAAIVDWEKLRQRREEGEDPAAEKRAQRAAERLQAEADKKAAADAKYLVKDLCNDYWENYIQHHRAKKGATEIKRLFAKDLGDLAEVPATQVSRAQAFGLIQGHALTKPVNAGKLRTELGGAWDYAIDAGKIPEETPNWWRKILRGKIKSKGKKISGKSIGTSKRVLNPVEIGMVLRWLPNMSQMMQDSLTLYLWTVCRGAEIVQMEGKEVSWEGDVLWWVIPKAKTKNARHEDATDLRVPLFGRAREIVLRRKERFGDGYLFPMRGHPEKHIDQKSIQSSLFVYQPYADFRRNEVPTRLPVSHWAPHDLRRTSRTLLASMGCTFEIAESIMGHMLPGVDGIYNLHKYDSERVEWLDKLSTRLDELAATLPPAS